MPQLATDDGVSLHYRLDGPEDAPVLVMSNSLGTDHTMWDPQMPALLQRFRVLRYDTRGHGKSSVPKAPYQVDRLGKDVLALMDALDIPKAMFCGLSMGGMTGMWLGVNAPDRFTKLVLCNTAAKIGTDQVWNDRIATVRKSGMAAITPGGIQRWLTEGFIKTSPETVEKVSALLLSTDPEGYCLACGAVRDMDQRESVAAIRAPTLVIAGTYDLPTPATDGKQLAETIPNARYVELPAAHLSNVEVVADFTKELTGFLAG
ncbi:MAG: 3-oxoadipate enol-lactonase [Alphaproteobacteria bacterium]|nr:3-oxoadipate enol-lactonase [Alphaproteobacteria bacterium]